MELLLQKMLTAFSRQKQPPEVFYKKSFSKKFLNFSFIIKLQAWDLELYLKKRLWLPSQKT